MLTTVGPWLSGQQGPEKTSWYLMEFAYDSKNPLLQGVVMDDRNSLSILCGSYKLKPW